MKLMTRTLGNILDILEVDDNTEIFIHSVDTDAIYYSVVKNEDEQGRMRRASLSPEGAFLACIDGSYKLKYYISEVDTLCHS